MREGWEIKKLGEVIKLEYGKPLPDFKRKAKGKYPVYGANGVKDRTDDFYHDKKSIVIGRKGSAGEINLTEEKFWPLDVTYFVTFDEKHYDLTFLYHILISLELPSLAKGVKPGINRNEVYDLEVLIPNLSEQKRIVSILDEAFAAIDKAKANLQRNLQNSKELFESYLQNVFAHKGEGWEEKRLSEVFQIKPPKDEARQKLNNNDSVTFLPMEDLNVLAYNIEPKKEKKLADVINAYTYFAEKDVLLAKITPCFENGKIGIARKLQNGIGFGSSEYVVFRANGSVIPEYLYYFLSRNQFKNEGKKKMTGAVGHKRVSKEFIEEYQITFPKSIALQKNIVNQLDGLSLKCQMHQSIYQKKLFDLEELKKSILQKAFAGELTYEKAKVYQSQQPVVSIAAEPIPVYQRANSNSLNEDEMLQLYFICFNLFAHQHQKEEATLGEVKMEKMCHFAEYTIPELKFNRNPLQEEYGPADFARLYRIHDFAEANNIFTHNRFDNYKKYPAGDNFHKWLKEAMQKIDRSVKQKITRLINLLKPLNTKKIDIYATTYAAWNNLLIQGKAVSFDSISKTGRWHARKEDFTDDDFKEATAFLKANNLVPNGTGKLVKSKTD